MRIYAVADIHAREERLRRIRDTVARALPDVLVIAGDLCQFRRPERILDLFDELPVPILAVRGNTDPARIEELFDIYPNINGLHLKRVEMDGVPFVGASGTVPLPLASRMSWHDSAVAQRLAELANADTVLVAHPPPYGILDVVLGRFHAGCRALRRLIDSAAPQLVLCGHIHEQAGVVVLERTVVVNCSLGKGGGGALVEITPGERPRVQMV